MIIESKGGRVELLRDICWRIDYLAERETLTIDQILVILGNVVGYVMRDMPSYDNLKEAIEVIMETAHVRMQHDALKKHEGTM